MIHCARGRRCARTLDRNNHWAMVQAHRDGWFIMKNGRAWCPDHIPAWVKAWREKKDST